MRSFDQTPRRQQLSAESESASTAQADQISTRVPISITRLVGMLKNSAAFMAFLDNATNRRLRHRIMLGVAPGTITAWEMKNEVSIISKASPCFAHSSSAEGRSGVSMKP